MRNSRDVRHCRARSARPPEVVLPALVTQRVVGASDLSLLNCSGASSYRRGRRATRPDRARSTRRRPSGRGHSIAVRRPRAVIERPLTTAALRRAPRSRGAPGNRRVLTSCAAAIASARRPFSFHFGRSDRVAAAFSAFSKPFSGRLPVRSFASASPGASISSCNFLTCAFGSGLHLLQLLDAIRQLARIAL